MKRDPDVLIANPRWLSALPVICISVLAFEFSVAVITILLAAVGTVFKWSFRIDDPIVWLICAFICFCALVLGVAAGKRCWRICSVMPRKKLWLLMGLISFLFVFVAPAPFVFVVVLSQLL